MLDLFKDGGGGGYKRKQQHTSEDKNHIDGVWATKYINFHVTIFIPLWPGIGHHRSSVVGITC